MAANRRDIILLGDHWAFGLRREPWLRMRPELEGYYALVRGRDYTLRNHREIYEYFAKSGAVPRGSSQDAAKSWVCSRLGLSRLRTFTPFARYIGSKGAHMTQELYDQAGYAHTVVQETEVTDLKFPSEHALAEMVSEQRRLLFEIYRDELAGILDHFSARERRAMRPCTAQDVANAYKLLLNRNPEFAGNNPSP